MAIDVPISLAEQSSNGHATTHTNGHSATNPAAASDININAAYPIINKQWLPIIGLFVFYVTHDALQERMFNFHGFQYGFFMTLVEVLVMLLGSLIFEGDYAICATFATKRRRSGKRRTLSLPVLIRIGWVGVFLALAHGLGNTSLNYSPFPLKVAFKSCKLVPTMALGACVTGRKHTALQYAAALVMGSGLAVLTAADVFNSRQQLPLAQGAGNDEWSKELGPFVGPILLTISTVFDSAIPNLQEQLLRGAAKVKTSEMILISNAVMCVVLVIYTIYSGELTSAFSYCTTHKDASVVLLMQGLSAWLGLKSYLAIIRDYGGVVGVLLANARKIVTIMLSFFLFVKPFNERHFVGLILVFIGIYLGYLSKKGTKEPSKDLQCPSSPGRRGSERKKKKRIDNESHEHNV